MVSGFLTEKKGNYYAVITYHDANGTTCRKWISTGLSVKKGTKKKAEEKLLEIRRNFVPPKPVDENGICREMLFADFMILWLDIIKPSVELTTFSSYQAMVTKKIAPYFRKKNITLGNLSASDIQLFYVHELKTISANSVIHEHANIHKALKYAVKLDIIPSNPADKVDRPKKNRYIAPYYNEEELVQLLEITKDHKFALFFQLAAFYGLRRSEISGLKWDAIDFVRNTITIKHVVTIAHVDGKKQLIEADRAKTKSSVRTLPLVAQFKEKFLELKKQQRINKKLCGSCYVTKYEGYIFVDPMGELYKPNTVGAAFKKVIEQNSLKPITLHGLRHSCASLLLANGVNMKQIQEWLGHSDIATTANIYSHLDYTSKLSSAGVIENKIKLPASPNNSNFSEN